MSPTDRLKKQNYKIYTKPSLYTITPADLTVTTSDFPAEGDDPVVYGDFGGEVQPDFQYEVTGLQNGDTAEAVLEGITLRADCQDCEDKYPANETGYDILADLSSITSTIAGNYNISVDQANIGKFVVLPADLTVTTISPESPALYGDLQPEFTATIEGYVYEESEADVFPDGLEITVACTECEVGTYEITASTSNAPANYTITYENVGVYSVGQAPLTISTESPAEAIEYGEQQPLFTVIAEGLQYSDVLSNIFPSGFTYQVGEDPGCTLCPVGTYAIAASSEDTPANYAVTFVDGGQLIVEKATLTITSESVLGEYGDEQPTFTGTVEGLKNGDAESDVLSDLAFSVPCTECPVGTYIIDGSATEPANYTLNFVNTGEYILSKAQLTITSESETGTYGDLKPDFTGTVVGLKYLDTESSVLNDLTFSVPCDQCPAGTYTITGTASDPENYTLNFVDSGTYMVNAFDLTLTVNNGVITYGDVGPFDFGYTLSSEVLPYGETGAGLFGTLLYSPTDGCDFGTTTSVTSQVQPANYNVTYVEGDLTIENTDLTIQVNGEAFIDIGDPIPSNFSISAQGLVCDDPIPVVNNFIIVDASGNPVSGNLQEGVYDVQADLGSLVGYEFYNVSQTAGKLYVNPVVGCNDRVRASDLCRLPASLPGDSKINTKLTFTYENRAGVPIYVPFGTRENKLKGNAYFVGEAPSLFLPGVHTFEIYTDGRALQWEVITPGCNSASKSPNGSNANPCDTSVALSSNVEVDSFTREFSENTPKAYPNPATDYLTLFVGDMDGAVRVTVFDEVGRQLMTREYTAEGQDEVYLDISGLKEGILMIRTENQGNPRSSESLRIRVGYDLNTADGEKAELGSAFSFFAHLWK